jgi:hypothetical protein
MRTRARRRPTFHVGRCRTSPYTHAEARRRPRVLAPHLCLLCVTLTDRRICATRHAPTGRAVPTMLPPRQPRRSRTFPTCAAMPCPYRGWVVTFPPRHTCLYKEQELAGRARCVVAQSHAPPPWPLTPSSRARLLSQLPSHSSTFPMSP